MKKKINIAQKLSQFKDHWNPRIIGELNHQHIKLAKLKGEFIWHKHDDEDEMFLVLKGTLKIAFRDRTETIQENEIIIVPKGVEHKPIAAVHYTMGGIWVDYNLMTASTMGLGLF